MDEQRNMDAESTRLQKRRRITNEADDSAVCQSAKEQLTSRVFSLLGSQIASDLDGLHLVAEWDSSTHCLDSYWKLTIYRKGFATLSTTDRCKALKDIGFVACAAAGTLDGAVESIGSMESMSCSVCDSASASAEQATSPSEWDDRERKELVMTLRSILKNAEFQNSTQPRMWAMLSIGRLVRHSSYCDFLNLASSYLGRWCLHSLQSSLRELRLAAGYVSPGY